MNQGYILLFLVLAWSSSCHALCTRGPEGPKGEQTSTTTPRTYKWINSSCVEFDGVVLCSSHYLAQQLVKDVTFLAVEGAGIALTLIVLGVLLWCFLTIPGLFYFWLKAQFVSAFVLGPITVPYKELTVWGWFVYWCVYASVWQSLNMVLDWGKQVWHRKIVPVWKDPASIASLKVE
jgi:hypothetical protein